MRMNPVAVAAALLVLLAGAAGHAPGYAGPLRERIAQRMAERARMHAAPLPPGARLVRDVAYGSDAAQRYDVYIPARPDGRVVAMVHGGGWKRGDKAMDSVVQHKGERWVAQGVVLVSVNYRMLPEADVATQALDVATAVADVQRRARSWGGDPAHLLLMGHSAGAHLVGLLAADYAPYRRTGLQAWRATVTLDSAAIDVPTLMAQTHARLYDDAFGSDPAYWRAMSPLQQVSVRATPTLLVCSTERGNASCGPARDYAARAARYGVRTQVLPEPLSHREINDALGTAGSYTRAVEQFFAQVDPAWR